MSYLSFQGHKVKSIMHYDHLQLILWKPIWKKHGGWAPNPNILIHTTTTCALAKMLQKNTQVWVSTVTICSPETDSPTSPAWGIHQISTWRFSQVCRRNEVVCKTKSCADHWILGRTGFDCGNSSGCRIQNHIQNQESISLHRAVRLLDSLSCCYPALFFVDSLLITGMGCPQFAPEKISLIMVLSLTLQTSILMGLFLTSRKGIRGAVESVLSKPRATWMKF